MIYSLAKVAIRLALKIFCCKLTVTGRAALSTHGPLLITANHPNSFLDAIIIGSVFERPVHFLARGDAFKKTWHNKLLRLLNMIPVYRLSEGKENLSLNEEAFRRSKEILTGNGIVLIFIEGICVHKHELQPFKKGAARIAFESRHNAALQILPVSIAYGSFEKFGKRININFGKLLSPQLLFPFNEEAKNIRYFNGVLYEEINQRIFVPSQKISPEKTKQYLFFLPGLAGYVLHLPLYSVIKNVIRKKTEQTVFYDSILFGALLFLYPVYLLLICFLLCLLHVSFLMILFIFFLHPFLAWCAVQWRCGFA